MNQNQINFDNQNHYNFKSLTPSSFKPIQFPFKNYKITTTDTNAIHTLIQIHIMLPSLNPKLPFFLLLLTIVQSLFFLLNFSIRFFLFIFKPSSFILTTVRDFTVLWLAVCGGLHAENIKCCLQMKAEQPGVLSSVLLSNIPPYMLMAYDQRRKRLNGASMVSYGSLEQYRTKRKNFGPPVQGNLTMKSWQRCLPYLEMTFTWETFSWNWVPHLVQVSFIQVVYQEQHLVSNTTVNSADHTSIAMTIQLHFLTTLPWQQIRQYIIAVKYSIKFATNLMLSLISKSFLHFIWIESQS